MANTTSDAFFKPNNIPHLPVLPVDMFKNDKPIYWEIETRRLYWIKSEDTGNNEISPRQYIATIN